MTIKLTNRRMIIREKLHAKFAKVQLRKDAQREEIILASFAKKLCVLCVKSKYKQMKTMKPMILGLCLIMIGMPFTYAQKNITLLISFSGLYQYFYSQIIMELI